MKFLIPIAFLLFCILLNQSCQNKEMKVTSSAVPTTNTLEQHRPHFHFTPPSKWMNDPNGMVYFDGEYHLFYQYHPDSTVWGPMHWGHAISKDLVHWEHLPIALYPDSLGYIFSGSAVIDWQNTSGFGEKGQPPMIAIFTYHDPIGEKAGTNTFQYQGIAYSNDKGRTWTKYAGNPVIPNPGIRDFRDPKVIWDKNSKQWIMIFAAWDHVKLYGSPNLKEWTHLSDFGQEWGAHTGVWECPDLFPITVEGTEEEKWVLLQSLNPGSYNGGSGTQYFIGNFDGKHFTIDEGFAENLNNEADKAIWLDYGRDNYAGVTWSDAPNEQRIFIGWMSNWDYAQVVPTETWRSAMTIARTLTLKNTESGLRLFTQPVAQMQSLRQATKNIVSQKGSGINIELSKQPPVIAEVILQFSIPENEKTVVSLALTNDKGEKYKIGYNAANRSFFSDRRKAGKIDFSDAFAKDVHLAPRISTANTIQLQVFFDVASAELFADEGMTILTDIFFPNEDFKRLQLLVEGGEAEILGGKVYELSK